MRRTIVSFLILLAAALPSLAATDPNPTARQRELVEKLLAQVNVNRTIEAMLHAMFTEMEKQFVEQASSDGAGDARAEAKEMFDLFRGKVAKIDFDSLMHDAYVRMYAKYFTENELADLVAFYDTPTGRKALETMPTLMAEGAQAGVRNLSPKIEEAMKEVMADYEKRRPWRKTMSDLRAVATAVESYAIDHDRYPAGDYAALKDALVPTYIRELPEKDMWDHEYAYVTSNDGAHYRVISAGADTNFEWDSRRIVVRKENETSAVQYRERLEDDLIYADGEFIQLPVQAKPKGK